MHDREQSIDNHQRFIAEALESEKVWVLTNDEGSAGCESEVDGGDVIPFWSTEDAAKATQKQSFAEYAVTETSLFEFLFLWLPGMLEDEIAVGTNWSPELVGMESDPEQLAEEIQAAMPEEMYTGYEEEFRRQLKAQQESEES